MKFIMGFIFKEMLGAKNTSKMKKGFKKDKRNLTYYFNKLIRFMTKVDNFVEVKTSKATKKIKAAKKVKSIPESINTIHFRTSYNAPKQTI